MRTFKEKYTITPNLEQLFPTTRLHAVSFFVDDSKEKLELKDFIGRSILDIDYDGEEGILSITLDEVQKEFKNE